MTTIASAKTAHSRARSGSRTALAVAAVVGLLLAAGGFAWHRHTATPSVPFADPAAAGRLTLCAVGGPVTKGSIDQPLPATIVSDLAAAAGAHPSAALFAYQPRPGVEPSEWTGIQLNGSAPVSDPTHPATTIDARSTTLGQFLKGYPALDQGWIQLRLELTAPDAAAPTTYAAAAIHVRGSTWTIADPGAAPCP